MSVLDFLAQLQSIPQPEAPSVIPAAPGTRPQDNQLIADIWGRKAPSQSAELQRIVALPRREQPDESIIESMTALLALPPRACACASMRRKCVTRLNHAQAWALSEIATCRGLLGPIGVGQGKTALNILAAMVIPNVKRVVLLVPPTLVTQLKSEYLLWREHFRVPSLIIRSETVAIVPGTPVVNVVPYSLLSRAEATTLLDQLEPEVIIADEAHRLRRMRDGAGAGRVLRYFIEHPKTRLLCWSGSLTDKSVKDYGDLASLALRSQSPLPINRDVLDEWAGAIDPPPPGQTAAPIGALALLCKPGEKLVDGFRRRLLDTPGVVATKSPGIGASLYMHTRDPGPMPASVENALADLRASWCRPDGEELVEAFAVAQCARQLACGFFYRWIFPRGEPRLLILDWLEARREWHREVRLKVKRREPHLDAPLLLARAAIRHWDHPSDDKSLPTWAAQSWPRWRDIRDQVKPETEAVWIDEWVARDAAEWAHTERGIVWYEHRAFGQRVAEIGGLTLHTGGPDAGPLIARETGERSIVASIKSHGEGRDGLQRIFDRQLVANPPVSKVTGGAGRWEQLLGRLHREGQQADEVNTWVYRHTIEMADAYNRARELAQYVRDTMGGYQKLLDTTCSF